MTKVTSSPLYEGIHFLAPKRAPDGARDENALTDMRFPAGEGQEARDDESDIRRLARVGAQPIYGLFRLRHGDGHRLSSAVAEPYHDAVAHALGSGICDARVDGDRLHSACIAIPPGARARFQ